MSSPLGHQFTPPKKQKQKKLIETVWERSLDRLGSVHKGREESGQLRLAQLQEGPCWNLYIKGRPRLQRQALHSALSATGHIGTKPKDAMWGAEGFVTRTSLWSRVSLEPGTAGCPPHKPPLTNSRVLTRGPQTPKGSMLEFRASLNLVSRKIHRIFVITNLELKLSISFHYDCR